ncbi:type VI secretion system contractile sheath small subunit [Legionella pneumophila serogroup 1]
MKVYDQSVAPKERVNIVYTPNIEGAEEAVELPLRQLVLGEFTRACPQSTSKFSPLFIILSKSLHTLRTPLI